jgi:hypothetical protein
VPNLGARRCPGMAGTKLENPVGSMIGLTSQRTRHLAIKSKGIQKIGNKRKRTTSLNSIEDRPSTRNRPLADSTNKNDTMVRRTGISRARTALLDCAALEAKAEYGRLVNMNKAK